MLITCPEGGWTVRATVRKCRRQTWIQWTTTSTTNLWHSRSLLNHWQPGQNCPSKVVSHKCIFGTKNIFIGIFMCRVIFCSGSFNGKKIKNKRRLIKVKICYLKFSKSSFSCWLKVILPKIQLCDEAFDASQICFNMEVDTAYMPWSSGKNCLTISKFDFMIRRLRSCYLSIIVFSVFIYSLNKK